MKPLRIFVADWLPLANKGEEALARGISDLLAGDRPCEIGIFDAVPEPCQHDNMVVFPRHWVYEVSGLWHSMSSREQLLRNAKIALKTHLGLFGRLRNMTEGEDPLYAPLRNFFNGSDVIVLGHGPMYCVESAGLALLSHRRGKPVVVLGAGISWPKKPYAHPWLIAPILGLLYAPLYRRAMDRMELCSVRNRTSHEVLKGIASNPSFPVLAPDMAFAMNPAGRDAARQVLSAIPAYQAARANGRLVLGATVCTASSTYLGAFKQASNTQEKERTYTRFMAHMFDRIIRDRNAFVLFLPHSIKKEVGDDVAVARMIAAAMTASPESCYILGADLSPRVLKAIIREMDFLLGQRAHSMIGAVSVGTPFVDFTNSRDTRSLEILGDMCGCRDQLVLLDDPDQQQVEEQVLACIDRREDIRCHLKDVSVRFARILDELVKPLRERLRVNASGTRPNSET